MHKTIKHNLLNNELMDKTTALSLINENLEELCQCADEVRQHFCSNQFDLCSIINGKSGRCSENCKFCSQSAMYDTNAESYSLLSLEDIKKEALHNASKGVQRFSIVTSGRKLAVQEAEQISLIYQDLSNHVPISLCASCGLLDLQQFKQLKTSGVQRYHNNLETSARFFPQICTSHTYEDKLKALREAKEAGLEICSGGIIGLGESWEDRIDLAIQLRDLGVTSIPLNFLNPIKGTPLENNIPITLDEARRITAIFRLLLPNAYIRLAGGRQLFEDKGASLFKCGANATITGDMLTTNGISIDEDMTTIKQLGYEVIPYE